MEDNEGEQASDPYEAEDEVEDGEDQLNHEADNNDDKEISDEDDEDEEVKEN